jgi:type VI secretion system secreted protein VgrG
MQLQAQHDDVEINASESVSITATHGRIAGTADKEVVFITTGGAYLKLSGANVEIGCPGSFTVKSASHNWSGPASMKGDLPTFKGGNPDQKFILHYSSGKEGLQQLAANRAYEVTMSDGSIVKGIADAAGNTSLLQKDAMHIAAIHVLDPKP